MNNIDAIFGSIEPNSKVFEGKRFNIKETNYSLSHDHTITGYSVIMKENPDVPGHIQIITHTDLDGYAAAAVVVNAFRETRFLRKIYNNINIYHSNYNSFPDLDKTADYIIFTDYSFQGIEMADQIIECLNLGIPVIYLDHHASGIKKLDEISQKPGYEALKHLPGLRSSDYCGTMLAWAYFNPGSLVPDFISLVDDYDCWKLKDPRSTHLTLAFNNISNEKWNRDPKDILWEELMFGTYDPMTSKSEFNRLNSYLEYGKSFEEHIRDFRYQQLLKQGFVSDIRYIGDQTVKAAIIVTADASSLVFGDLLATDSNPNGHFTHGMVIHDHGSYCSVSLYSKSDAKPNAREICEHFGGGGHPGAAGFTWDRVHDPIGKSFYPYDLQSVIPMTKYLKENGLL